MSKYETVCVVVAVISLHLVSGVAGAAIPTSERDALIALYNGTGGPGWDDSTNWLNPAGTECTWFGVICSGGDANVVELNLVGNNLVGMLPAEIADLTQIETIFLGWNQLMGNIPPELGSLPMLRTLGIPGNEFHGEIPPELGNLGALEWLNIRRNQLSGSIPPELGSLANVWWFAAHQNRLTGALPPELGNMASLQEIYLRDNQLTGEIPAALASLPGLFWVDFGGNDFTGSIPPEFGGATNLVGLLLWGNELEGEIPVELGSLPNIGHLDLADNNLVGSIPAALGNLTTLGFLNLGMNQLTGPIPAEIGSLTNLTELFLNDNRLEGSIPAEIGGLTALGQLHLQENNLTGALPPEIGSLTSLGHLDLARNHLSGSIPTNIGNLTNLGFLNLNNNLLSGPIPAEIGGLVNLGELFLGWNRLNGAIPPEIGGLGSLWALDLSNNRLEGQIPSEFGSLGNLQWMSLRGNKLMGPVPATITNLVSLQDHNSDIQMNGLYSGDPGVVAFLDLKCNPEWKDIQTVVPSNFGVSHATGVSVTLGWDPIAYNWNAGGYDILVSESASGPFLRYSRAVDKNAGSWTLFGLLPSTTYYFEICSVTEAGAENQNTVISEPTPPLAVATTSAPSTWYAAEDGVFGNDCATPSSPCPTILAALDRAGPGEVVHVAPGTYSERLFITEPVMLVGDDPATTVIQGHGWGPVVEVQTGAQASLSGFTIRGGQVERGAGVFVGWRAHAELENLVVTMNQAAVMGGGVYVECEGGAILDRVAITGNTAGDRGGGLGACGGTLVTDSEISLNSAPWGGGVAIQGATQIDRTTIADNTATNFGGGGVLNEGSLVVSNSTVYGNTASHGGGLANSLWANLMVSNSTVSSNEGGGVFNDQYAVVGMDGCTLVNNTGPETEHSGLMNWDQFFLRNTIVAGNLPLNCANRVTSQGFNLEDSDTCGFDGPGDLRNTDPMLGPLAANGGPTWTHALPPGSPAIDLGDPAEPSATDQRGYRRPVDGDFDGIAVADVGAVEFVGPLFSDDFESGDTTAWAAVSP